MTAPVLPRPAPPAPKTHRAPLDPLEVEAALEQCPHDPLLRFVADALARQNPRAPRPSQTRTRTRSGAGRRRRGPPPDSIAMLGGTAALLENLQLEVAALDDDALGRTPAAPHIEVGTLWPGAPPAHPLTGLPRAAPEDLPELLAACPEDRWALCAPSGSSLEALGALAQPVSDALGARLGLPDLGPDVVARAVSALGGPKVMAALRAAPGPRMLVGSDLHLALGTDLGLVVGEPDAESRALAKRCAALDVPAAALPGLGVVVATRPGGLDAIVAAARGRAPSLADSDEAHALRGLVPPRADELGWWVLGDACLRRMSHPAAAIAERRRRRCAALLRMLEHAAALFARQSGRAPRDVLELHAAGAAPGIFGAGALACPEGGHLHLDVTGRTWCGVHHGERRPGQGGPGWMRPAGELLPARVTDEEAGAYREGLEAARARWTEWFDPACVRICDDGARVRIDTAVLPISADSALRPLLHTAAHNPPRPRPRRSDAGGDDAAPAGRVFTLGARLPVRSLLEKVPAGLERALLDEGLRRSGLDAQTRGSAAALDVRALLERGLGAEVRVHVLDADPLVELDLPMLFGRALVALDAPRAEARFLFSALAVSLVNAPVCVELPVTDVAVVDDFLGHIDALLAQLARVRDDADPDAWTLRATRIDTAAGPVSSVSGATMGFRLRLFWARRGDGLWLSTRLAPLADPSAAPASPGDASAGDLVPDPPVATLTLDRASAVQSARVLRLAAAEGEQGACLSALARANARGRLGFATGAPRCPSGGRIVPGRPGEARCERHGHPQQPRLGHPSAPGPFATLLGEGPGGFERLDARLWFVDDGALARLELIRPAS